MDYVWISNTGWPLVNIVLLYNLSIGNCIIDYINYVKGHTNIKSNPIRTDNNYANLY